MKPTLLRWRANFLTGLAVVLPAVISIAIFRWLFGTVSNVTDTLLFFVPRAWTHASDGPRASRAIAIRVAPASPGRAGTTGSPLGLSKATRKSSS